MAWLNICENIGPRKLPAINTVWGIKRGRPNRCFSRAAVVSPLNFAAAHPGLVWLDPHIENAAEREAAL